MSRHPWLSFLLVGCLPALLLSGNVLGHGISLAALFPALAAVLVTSAGDAPHPVAGDLQRRLLVAAGIVIVLLGVALARTAVEAPVYTALVTAVPAVLAAWVLSGVYSPSEQVRDLVRALASWRAPRSTLLVAALVWPSVVGLSILVCSRLTGIDVALPRESDWSLLAGWMVTGVFASALDALAWYGFATRRLLRRLSPLAVGLGVGGAQWLLVWGPELRPAALADPFFLSRLASSLAVAVVGVWVYRRSAGSLLPVWLMGALLVASRGLALVVVTPALVERSSTFSEVFSVVAVATALVAVVAGRMWRGPAAAEDVTPGTEAKG
jgi:hypothetical protein